MEVVVEATIFAQFVIWRMTGFTEVTPELPLTVPPILPPQSGGETVNSHSVAIVRPGPGAPDYASRARTARAGLGAPVNMQQSSGCARVSVFPTR